MFTFATPALKPVPWALAAVNGPTDPININVNAYFKAIPRVFSSN
jgi:hypothetical protein